ncbi:hypothetical protein [Mycobacteroides abscessus]|uniref:hypothetical protein n=1 Tax=Mycobacteroides abscessus TaxID=36809 RepID=UPI001877AFA5
MSHNDLPASAVAEPWSYTDAKTIPATLTVEPAATNSFGAPIYLQIQRGDRREGIWVDLETWEAMYRAGLAAHAAREELTAQGWT